MTLRKIVIIFLLSTVIALPQLTNAGEAAPKIKHCLDSDLTCGLSGIERAELLDALYQGLTDLPIGFTGRAIGFPADVLAGAYGIDIQGQKFSIGGTLGAVATFPVEAALPHYYSYRAHRAMLSELESALAHAKVHMSEPDHAPALVAMNVPGKGPRVYDADQLRALVATDLFAYPMHFEWKRSSGVSVPFVQLNRKTAMFVRKCLEEMGFSAKGSLPSQIKDGGCPSVTNVPAHEQATTVLPGAGAAFLGGGLGSDRDVTIEVDRKSANTIAKILVRHTKDRIQVVTKPCTLWQDIPRHAPDVKYPDKILGCEFLSDLYIPRTVGAAYAEIRVTVTPVNPTTFSLVCGPDDKDLDVTSGDKVVAPKHPCRKATWQLSGDILSPPTQSKPCDPLQTPECEPTQTLVTYVEHEKTRDDPAYKEDETTKSKIRSMFRVKITLEGTIGPWWEPFFEHLRGRSDQTTYYWCVPEDPCP